VPDGQDERPLNSVKSHRRVGMSAVRSGSAKQQSHPLATSRAHAASLRHLVLNFIVSGQQMEQIEPALFATLKQDAAILKSTRALYHKGGSSQLYCHELPD